MTKPVAGKMTLTDFNKKWRHIAKRLEAIRDTEML